MKVVIFAGGLGTRISEESHLRPKPMIEIGSKPILWHIMKIYESQGFNEFVICLGYKGYQIKEYFMNYFMHNSDVTIDIRSNEIEVHETNTEAFKVTLVDTGLHTKTAGRLRRVQPYLEDQEHFMLTYGDGVANVNVKELLQFHHSHGKIASMTSVQPGGRYGVASIDEETSQVVEFIEKPKEDGGWINGGFFVLRNEVFNYLPDDADDVMWEDQPMTDLADEGHLMAYKHDGFWKAMDAMRDKKVLEDMWKSGTARWKIWD